MRIPNLFIIGAMKAGTTALHAGLAQHPDIAMSEPKEPSYFVAPGDLVRLYPEMWRKRLWKNEARYLSVFGDTTAARVVGESSTAYTKLPMARGVPLRIARFNPEARFVFLMRDPVERALSHYGHDVVHDRESRPPLAAMRAEPRYLAVSDYARQLEAYFEYFEASQFKLLTFEAFKAQPAAVLQEVCGWLGLGPVELAPPPEQARNTTPAAVSYMRLAPVARWLRNVPGGPALVARAPRRWRRAVRGRAQSRAVERSMIDVGPAREYLQAQLRPRVAALSQLTGMTFPEWRHFPQPSG